jgi:hypothetical protein
LKGFRFRGFIFTLKSYRDRNVNRQRDREREREGERERQRDRWRERERNRETELPERKEDREKEGEREGRITNLFGRIQVKLSSIQNAVSADQLPTFFERLPPPQDPSRSSVDILTR